MGNRLTRWLHVFGEPVEGSADGRAAASEIPLREVAELKPCYVLE